MGRLEKLPESLLVEVFQFLSIEEIIRVQRVCKFFFSLFKEEPMILFNSLRGLYQSPFFPCDVCPTYQGVKRIFSKIHYSKRIMIEMFAFFTNGGYTKNDPYESMVNVFSSKLFDKCYNAVRDNNILIKAIFCGGKFVYNVNRSDWEKIGIREMRGLSKFEIDLTDLRARLERILRNTCKEIIITGFFIEKPSYLNKSSFRTCIIFSSLCFTTSLHPIKSFNFIRSLSEVYEVSESLNLETRTEINSEYIIVYFQKSNLPIRPLLWIQFKDQNISTDILEVQVDQQYLGSYLYILFIDSFNPYVAGLNIGTFITQAKILNLYE